LLVVVLTLSVIILLSIHFGVPLIYYEYLKSRWLNKSWNLKIDVTYRPSVAVVVPTYNESYLIENKLENINEQTYPKELTKIIIADSASTDNTIQAITEWQKTHPKTKLDIVEETIRQGKMFAVSKACENTSSEIVIVGDADSLWDKTAIENVVKYFADPSVGALTATLSYSSGNGITIENTYRNFYNLQRVAESKVHSTPIHSGVLQAIRRRLVQEHGAYLNSGVEDCAIASYIAFLGYRAIQTSDVVAYEPMRGNLFSTKIRRARHNIINFILTKKYTIANKEYIKTDFDFVWKIEKYLYLLNPMLLVTSIGLLVCLTVVSQSIIILILLGLAGIGVSINRISRMWLLQQIFLISGMIQSLYNLNYNFNSKRKQ
jgi:cellulose synthase/poly-beta-1,6-N-acetylglucosamine synthase-like glycosyltransferase